MFFWRRVAPQIPEEGLKPTATPGYTRNFRDLNDLVSRGKSFSGYERNPFYLNLKGRGFSETAALLGSADRVHREMTVADCDYVGAGYGIPTPGMIEAVTMMARLEGILLDPVYSGKGMAGLIDLCRKGHFKKGENIVFLHTGGSVALYGYMDAFDSLKPL